MSMSSWLVEMRSRGMLMMLRLVYCASACVTGAKAANPLHVAPRGGMRPGRQVRGRGLGDAACNRCQQPAGAHDRLRWEVA